MTKLQAINDAIKSFNEEGESWVLAAQRKREEVDVRGQKDAQLITIYGLQLLKTMKWYVGKTTDLEKRLELHDNRPPTKMLPDLDKCLPITAQVEVHVLHMWGRGT
ncbi:hypothetical protein CEUSTIGMA_g9763.t1 [Chlamydomonas eustigma]|uniref:GIY-YIG domain-containing protein n=1 Tax=Chlamydomonas eustigma TaxID=1157962 RepID=A0A250XGY1_9CHLO|nr:hypothetical protein CEUSTIGMA_g9763.t1 [Chlamydomonas eustigma]|eukprot:GAX82334.1 hypothetical protein CEUSTIGMA_g9763.t1 [Chlamydomonas eustigma]